MLLYWLLPLPVILGAFAFAHRRFEALTTVFLLAALALCYFHFYRSSWTEFTPDAQSHAEYVRLLAHNGGHMPPFKATAATRHPPAYYEAAALLYRLGEMKGVSDPLLIARHLSMALYAVFLVLGTLLLRLLLKPPTASYYAALGMFLFWPIGVTLGGRITCDIPMFAAEIGALYGLSRWLVEEDIESLSLAFLFSGAAVLSKTMGVLAVGMSGTVLLLALRKNRYDLRPFLRRDLIGSVLFAGASCLVTLFRDHITGGIEKLPPYWHEWWHMVSSFSPYLFLFDTEMFDSEGKFWNIFLHSLVLGDPTQPWKYFDIPLILLGINVLWAAILLYLIFGLLTAWRQIGEQDKKVLGVIGCYGLLGMGGMLYMILITNNLAYGDARYIYPAVVGIAATHGRIMDWQLALGRRDVWRIGLGLAACFCLLSFALYLTQHLPFVGMNCHYFRSPAHC